MSPDRRRSIEVVEYDPAWPILFEEVHARLEQLLSGLVAEIHHIGSTAVPGLSAKPKIDVDILLRRPADIPEAIERMQATRDYTFHGDRHQDDMWVFTTGRGSYGQRLYLCAPEHPTHLRRILFRDYLRRYPEAAATYAALKHRLHLRPSMTGITTREARDRSSPKSCGER
ncbi:GrpB family protein [Lichenifustis flavocetrariae]|uniref:GrpB family protein n=1 Tax=Lichenifustis flavocetrariae TaxID=2949735 RepID=UPI0031F4C88F